MASSYQLTPGVAEQAVGLLAMPTIRAVLAQLNRTDLHIVVLDPLKTFVNTTFDEAVLYEQSLGVPREWKHDFATIARKKAEVAWRTGMSSHVVQQYSHLYVKGDSPFAGGVVHHGIVVGVSGVRSYFDEYFAFVVAAACAALCKKSMLEQLKGEQFAFIGEGND